jgi:hypothetical protein
MKKLLICAVSVLALSACTKTEGSNPAATRQAAATTKAMDAADREIGMPRIANFAQRKLLKNAYEDMDQTTLTYVYAQGMDGRFVCLGQAVGYGVSLGTQFTPPTYPQRIHVPYADGESRATAYVYEQGLPEPNGLYMPESGAATIVNLVDPATGKARTALVEPNVVTSPNKLPASAVAIQCPGDVDPANVSDAKETSAVKQRS